MNRLQHFLHAKTQFNLHSPFVYGLYTEVLFSRAPGAPRGRYESTVWRLEQRYGIQAQRLDGSATLHAPEADFLVVNHPHRDEARWQDIVENPRYQATIDLFSVGIAVTNPHLSKQHFILR